MDSARSPHIHHTFVPTNGINMHLAQLGPSSGPAVLLLHGFPEIWYSWRYQLQSLAHAGLRAIAPDFRGYGLTENPDAGKNSLTDLVDDLIGLLDAIGEDKVFVVAKDFGAIVGYMLSFLHPGRVRAMVSLGIVYRRPVLYASIISRVPDGYYLKRWTVPGRAEADFGRFDVATVIKRIYIMFSKSERFIAPEDKEIMDLIDPSAPLPDWFTEEDLKVYASLYERSGFDYPLEVPYRCWQRTADKLSSVEDYAIPVPVLLILGRKDYSLQNSSMEQNVQVMRGDVPKLEAVDIEDGCHFVQEQKPEQVNELIVAFLNRQLSQG